MRTVVLLLLAGLTACGGNKGSGDGPGGGVTFNDGAPALNGVTVTANLDSAILTLPVVAGAGDYRVFAMPDGASVSLNSGLETVKGTTIYCAGLEQHNAPVAPPKLVQRVEVSGLTQPTRFVVEAVDRLCPFAGVMGSSHANIAMTNTEVAPSDQVPFSIFSEAEIRAKYGSLIVNGQGPGPKIGLQAPPDPPKVLARTQIVLTPSPAANRPAMTFFDDFSAPDRPVLLGDTPTAARSDSGSILQNSKWTFYVYGYDHAIDLGYQIFFDRGQMHGVLADFTQDVFASILAIPRRVAQLSSTSYLHVTWEVESNATSRRYWWILLCGAGSAGQTLDANGKLMGSIVPTSAFMEPDGLDPSVAGWNCLHVFPRDGWPFALPPSNTNPETDLRVMINKPGGGANNRTNVVNLSPDQFHDASIGPPSWYRQIDATMQPAAPILDDLQGVAPAVHFDLYVRRDRVILFANGKQRLCNDFRSNALSMAEAAVSFSQVLYHSTAERMEFSVDYWDKTGQRYYLTDTPYLDSRTWDNLGYDENVSAPSSFDPSVCFNHG